MFIELKASVALGEDEPSVYDYVTTLQGRLYTYGDSDVEMAIGWLRAWKIDLEAIEADEMDPWEVMDAEDGELEALYSAVFDVSTGEFKPAVMRAADLESPPLHIVAIHTLVIEEPYRGERLSLGLIKRVLDVLGGRGDMAALFPYPLGMRGEEGHRIKRAQRKLSIYWQSAGFQSIPGSDWLVQNAGNRLRWRGA